MTWKNGFSLIELVLALAISSILLVTIMGLTAQLAQASKQLSQLHPVTPWVNVLRSQIENDYRHADSIIVKPKEILIRSVAMPHSLSKLEQEFSALPVPLLITYRSSQMDGSSVLYRTETRLDRSAPSRIRQLMCQGVDRFSVAERLNTDVPPGVLRLQLHFTQEVSAPVLDLVLVKHGVMQ